MLNLWLSCLDLKWSIQNLLRTYLVLVHVFVNTVTYLYLGLFILFMQKVKVPKVKVFYPF